ncbi:MAG: cyanophycinase [Armatimonadota bacterium]
MKQGAVILVGGGDTPPEVPRTLLELAGGVQARVVILAHAQADVGRGAQRSATFFQEHGAQNIVAPDTLDPDTLAELLNAAQGVWIPGGDQNRFMARLGASAAFLGALRGVLRRGGVVGGTSAGASLMGTLMPTGKQSPEGELRVGGCSLAPALNLLPNTIVDQHFLKRGRLLRLIGAVLENPLLTGVGVDEGAWAVVQGNTLRVQRGQVVVIRARAKPHRHENLLGIRDLRLQILLPLDTTRL